MCAFADLIAVLVYFEVGLLLPQFLHPIEPALMDNHRMIVSRFAQRKRPLFAS